MPQFDKLSFFNQIFWLLIIFFLFYFILTIFFLPRLSSILKIRQKILKDSLKGVNIFLVEIKNINIFLLNNCINFLNNLYSTIFNNFKLNSFSFLDLNFIFIKQNWINFFKNESKLSWERSVFYFKISNFIK